MKIQIMGEKIRLRCKGKTLLGIVNKLFQKFVDITQQCFFYQEFEFPLKVKVIGSNPSYLLQSPPKETTWTLLFLSRNNTEKAKK